MDINKLIKHLPVLTSIILGCFFSNSAQSQSSEATGKIRLDEVYDRDKLKGGYELVYGRVGDLNLILLNKGESSKRIRDSELDHGRHVLGYLYADFENDFVLYHRYGSNPFQIEIFNKESGKRLFTGEAPFYENTQSQIIMFESYGRNKLILYDSARKKIETLTAAESNPCVAGTCWEVIEISPNEIKIKYLTRDNKETIINFQR